MKIRQTLRTLISCGLAAAALTATNSLANLTLFPDAASFGGIPIEDGGTGDATGAITGQIVIDTPIAIPGTGGNITFIGLIEEVLVPPISGGLPAERRIRITEIPAGMGFNNQSSPATFRNVSGSSFILTNDIILVDLPYAPQLANWPPFGFQPTLELDLNGTLEEGANPLSGTEGIQMHVSASTQWVNGVPGGTVTAGWGSPGGTTGPLTVSASSSELGDFDGNPGNMRLTMDRLELEPDSSFQFPTSIFAGSGVIPEPGTIVLMLPAMAFLLLRRRR